MIIRIAACLLTLGFLAACQSTTTTKRETLRETTARYASNEGPSSTLNEPAPPAEGPEDVRLLADQADARRASWRHCPEPRSPA